MQIREVPFRSLGGVFGQDDVAAAMRVIQAAAEPDGTFFPLPEETDFQDALAAHEGADRAVIVNSCGTALDLCMYVLGIGPGDEVITSGLTFVCTATCAAARGANVVFADIDSETLCLDPAAVEAKITERTKAIIPIHFAGHACNAEAFETLSRRHGVPVIYDAAHAVGTKWQGEPIGGWGLASCYSFQSNKNMTTLGEGGAIVSSDAEFAEKVRQAKTFGYIYGKELRVVSVGFNYRMTKPQAAVGLTQLAKVDDVCAARREHFLRLNELLQDVPEVIVAPGVDPAHACHIYVLRLNRERLSCDRDRFRQLLKDKYKVGTALHYPAVWDWEVAARFDYDNSDCANTMRACKSVLTMPVFPDTSEEDLQYIARALKQAVAESAKETDE